MDALAKLAVIDPSVSDARAATMKLVLFALKADAAGKLRVGVQVEDGIAPVTGDDGAGFESMRRFLELGDAGRALAERAVADKASHVAADAAVLKAPIYDPEKVLCIGMNYVDHCTEQGLPIPEEPVVFNKFASSIIAPGEPLVKPPETTEFDFEVELAIVIGKPARRVPADKAMDHVAGEERRGGDRGSGAQAASLCRRRRVLLLVAVLVQGSRLRTMSQRAIGS